MSKALAESAPCEGRTITRLDLVNLEQRVLRERRAHNELSATNATILKLVDLYREAHGWDDDNDSGAVR